MGDSVEIGSTDETTDESTSTEDQSMRKASISVSLDWENLFKKGVQEPRKDVLKATSHPRETVSFITGSTYTGRWNALGMDISGIYLFPHGCEYDGGIEDGRFHGEGVLNYPMGQKLRGVWNKGKLVSYGFTNIDGLVHKQPWSYCRMPDRRFAVSIRQGLQPAPKEFRTNQQPTRTIEPNQYDTGDGFFDPATSSIFTARDPADYEDLDKRESIETVDVEDPDDDYWVSAVTTVSPTKAKWIKDHCRKGWDEPSGYRPEFYEDWISGRRKELEELELKYQVQAEDSIMELRRLSDHIVTTIIEPDSGLTRTSYQFSGSGRDLPLPPIIMDSCSSATFRKQLEILHSPFRQDF